MPRLSSLFMVGGVGLFVLGIAALLSVTLIPGLGVGVATALLIAAGASAGLGLATFLSFALYRVFHKPNVQPSDSGGNLTATATRNTDGVNQVRKSIVDGRAVMAARRSPETKKAHTEEKKHQNFDEMRVEVGGVVVDEKGKTSLDTKGVSSTRLSSDSDPE